MAPGAGVDLSAILDPEIGNIDVSSSGGSDNANASGRTSAVDPDQFSRIDEGDEHDESPEWFAKEVWHTCSPEQKAMIKEIEIEAREPEIELDTDDDIIHWKEQFNEFENQENWTAAQTRQPQTTRGFTDVVAITWPDQDEQGNAYVSIQFPGDAAKLITMEPVPEKHRAEIRAYLQTNASQILLETEEEPVIDGGKSYDDLTSSDYKEYADKVGEAVYAEMETWIAHDCFEKIPRAGARNILDLRWVGKWKS